MADDGTQTVAVVECPPQFNCTSDAVTMESIHLKPGWWRADYTTFNARECPQLKWCKGGPMFSKNETEAARARLASGDAAANTWQTQMQSRAANGVCSPGHVGPYCSVCVDGWYKVDQQCTVCPSAAAGEVAKALGVVIGGCLLCVLVLYCAFKRFKAWQAKKAERAKAQAEADAEADDGTLSSDDDGQAGQGGRLALQEAPRSAGVKSGVAVAGAGAGVLAVAGTGAGAQSEDTEQLPGPLYDETAEKATKLKGLLIKVRVCVGLARMSGACIDV